MAQTQQDLARDGNGGSTEQRADVWHGL
jgi:hypothetical protein